MILISEKTFSQGYSYDIKLENINNIYDAKYVRDDIMTLFKSFPIFNDSTKLFTVNSIVNITENKLHEILEINGYKLIYLKRTQIEIIKE